MLPGRMEINYSRSALAKSLFGLLLMFVSALKDGAIEISTKRHQYRMSSGLRCIVDWLSAFNRLKAMTPGSRALRNNFTVRHLASLSEVPLTQMSLILSLTIHHSPLTIHYSLLITHHQPYREYLAMIALSCLAFSSPSVLAILPLVVASTNITPSSLTANTT